MTYIPSGPGKPVNMTLCEDVVRDATALTAICRIRSRNCSSTLSRSNNAGAGSANG